MALYKDAKGLPAGTSWTQYTSALSRAKARDLPIGVLHLGERRHVRGLSDGPGVVAIAPGGSDLVTHHDGSAVLHRGP